MPTQDGDQAIIGRIDSTLKKTSIVPAYGTDDYDELISEQISTLVHTIESLVVPGTSFHTQLQTATAPRLGRVNTHFGERRDELRGILKLLRSAYADGYLVSLRELVHADLFGDFLEMAQYLLSEGYKDPSAVLVGGVLEEHLRKLCVKSAIAVANPSDGKPRKSGSLNDELAKSGVYDTLEQKIVTAWLDLRNKAAHGKYATYDEKQVEGMLAGVREFLIRHRA